MFNAVSGKSEASPHFDLASRHRVRVRFRIRPGGEEQKNDQDVLFLCCRRTFSHVQPIEFSLLSKNVSRISRQDSVTTPHFLVQSGLQSELDQSRSQKDEAGKMYKDTELNMYYNRATKGRRES